MRVNETFVSLQGEGHFTGTAAFFLRLSGCNLACPFCDTVHQPHTEMSEDEIVAEALSHRPRHIVITGGEPALQLTPSLVGKLHEAGFFVQVETNGTLPLPPGIDWVTCSPKGEKASPTPSKGGENRRENLPVLSEGGGKDGDNPIDELKVLYHGKGTDLSLYESIPAKEYRLQPLDTGDDVQNRIILRDAMDYVLQHPQWKLSLQTHKLLGIR